MLFYWVQWNHMWNLLDIEDCLFIIWAHKLWFRALALGLPPYQVLFQTKDNLGRNYCPCNTTKAYANKNPATEKQQIWSMQNPKKLMPIKILQQKSNWYDLCTTYWLYKVVFTSCGAICSHVIQLYYFETQYVEHKM